MDMNKNQIQDELFTDVVLQRRRSVFQLLINQVRGEVCSELRIRKTQKDGLRMIRFDQSNLACHGC
jgi:hypothetical protein